jgi:L-threonylcarbamoyladenylate synthase
LPAGRIVRLGATADFHHGLLDSQPVRPLLRYDLKGRTLAPDEVNEIVGRLRAGELIVYPTDTLYAVGCLALHKEGVLRLREAKGRDRHKPLPVIASDLSQARSLAAHWPASAERLAREFWPGPLTLVLEAVAALPDALLSGVSTVAIRVPDSETACALAREAGPLVSTSANLAGEPPCPTVDLALRAFPGVDMAVNMGPLEGLPSTIVEVTGADDGVSILRLGRIDRGRIEAVARIR